ncbi:hypothetical protein [Kineococcus rhizosphaerae]|uniref:Glycosyl transferase family 2 n=1 Tax=Kineococcus rhizosphaerae TaxID=559628 RepID=A0A2T0R4K8_9ACTN|nr:hypothetical protein [Kineococcus rhizosphaerae]PRY15296.1 hypothetical protein CLV37_105224 [Kineococcus rhizosphaerae]
MPVTRAYVVLPTTPADLPVLETCLEHLVAAADESAAAGTPTTIVVSTSAGAAALRPVLRSWAPLVNLLDDVELTVRHHHGATGRGDLRARSARALAARVRHAGSTVVLTTTTDVVVAPEWVTEHVRHHLDGARASTGPVRGGGPVHEVAVNLAARADLLPALLRDGRQVPLVHALSPVVATPRVILPASP